MRFSLATISVALCLCALSSGAEADDRRCSVLTRDLAQGAYLVREWTAATPCKLTNPALPIAYDRLAHAPFATAAIPAGTYLGQISVASERVFKTGEPLRVRYLDGPVAIERDVRLVTTARPGERALVRTADGTILALPFLAADVPTTESGEP